MVKMNRRIVYTITIILLMVMYLGAFSLSSRAETKAPITAVGGLWSRILEEPTYAPPIAANRAVYIGSNAGVLYILDSKSGKLEREFKTDYRFPCYPLVSGDGNVYLTTNNGALYALNAFTGELKWSILENASQVYSNPAGFPYYYVYRPAQSGELVFFNTPDSSLCAVNTETGQLKWKHQSEADFITYPAVSGNKVFVGDEKGILFALDTDSGQEKWRYQTDASIIYPPAAKKNEIFLGSTDGTLYVLDSETGKPKWQYSGANRIESSPVIKGNSVYMAASNGKLFSLDIKKRHLKWKFDVEGFVVSQPVVYKDLVYMGSNDGKLYALSADKGEPIWAYESKGNFVNQVAIANNRIYAIADIKMKEKYVSNILVFKSGLYPGVRVTIYAGKENPLIAWATDFFSAPAKEILRTKSPTFSEKISNLPTWPLGFYNIAVIHSLTEIFTKPSATVSQKSLDRTLRYILPGISICGLTGLLALTPFILILLSAFLIYGWSLLMLVIVLANSALMKLTIGAAGSGPSRNTMKLPFHLLAEAFRSTLKHLRLVLIVLLETSSVLLIAWILLAYLEPIRVWSFYLVIFFSWTLMILLSCLTHAYSLIQINKELNLEGGNLATDYFGRVLIISLIFILLSFLIISCLGLGKSYNLYLLSAFGVAFMTLAFFLLPFTTTFAVLKNHTCFSAIKSSVRLVTGDLVSTLFFLLSTMLALGLVSIVISFLNTLPLKILSVPISLLLSSFMAVYLVNLQSFTFNHLTGSKL